MTFDIGSSVYWVRYPRGGGAEYVPARVLHVGKERLTLAIAPVSGGTVRKKATPVRLAPRTVHVPALDGVGLSKL